MGVIKTREDRVGYVRLDAPPENVISQAMRAGLLEAVTWAEALHLDRVILSGSETVFATGADALACNAAPVAPHLLDVLDAIDQSDVPWIAAIAGVALGGGAELAMACRMRIAAPGAKIGLPDVTWGVIPGAGGTARLPRLVGLPRALEMITTGTAVPAIAAQAAGLIHAVETDPVEAAFLVNTEALGCIVPSWELPTPDVDPTAFDAIRARLATTARGQIAPLRAVEVIEAGLALPFGAALRLERAAFLDLRDGAQAKALRHIYLAERAAKAPAALTASPQDPLHVAVVGDGFIGDRILARYREAADTVLMDGSTPWEVDEAMVDFGYAMGPYEAQDLSGLDIAHAHRRRQDATRDPNRRYIPIADRMVELGKLGKKTGAGWYRYPGGGGKVEDPIVADLALEEAYFAGITRTDYTPPEITERLMLAMINEAADILDEGIAACAADIDLVTVHGHGFPRWRGGLLYHADQIGVHAIVERLAALAEEDPVAWRVSPVLLACARDARPLRDAHPGQGAE